jgi:hypothetical protein
MPLSLRALLPPMCVSGNFPPRTSNIFIASKTIQIETINKEVSNVMSISIIFVDANIDYCAD